ncbi:MAG TPA: recombination regulator RecX [Burkholderiales bacterium]|nr:recombination regulator RecX [Burkholderiales bacterium]
MEHEAPDTSAELKARALRHLVRREHSRAELARKLAPHAESPEALQAVLDLLLSKKQLSDERFAEERARVLSRKYGAARIRHDLKARGVSGDISSRVSGKLNELESAKAILARKYREPANNREERAKRARFLQGRGFSYEVIRAAMADLPEG